MIYIYDNKWDIPEGKKLIEDVETWQFHSVSRTPAVEVALRDIEQGSYLDGQHFVNKSGDRCDWSNLSTGAKAVILATMRSDTVVSFAKAGDKAYECMFSNNLSGSIFTPWVDVLTTLDCKDTAVDFTYGEKVYHSIAEYEGM